MLLCTEHKLFSKTYILCIQRFGCSTVSFTAREDTHITWGIDYLMGQVSVLGTFFLRAIARAYCTFVLREVLQVLPRLNDLVTECFFLLNKQQRKALTVTNVTLHPRAFANVKFMPL